MLKRMLSVAGVCAVVVSSIACEVSKSANPLTPTIAGPIPGVNITAPAIVVPSSGAKIPMDQQPITLTVANASTNGVRPLSYLFEVATDANFTNKVFAHDGITPGSGQTSLRLPDALATGRSYYWHARAQDGANTGPYSSAVAFNVFTPIVIGAPPLVAPPTNTMIDSVRPTFVVNDVARSGPVGAISYQIEVADSDSFANKTAVWTQSEQANQTNLATPVDLGYSKVYYWHVRAADPTTLGAWSPTAVFTTPPKPAVPSPSPSPSGPAPNDALNLGSAIVFSSPPDIASWPATGTITSMTMSNAGGQTFAFTTENSWPDVVPPGFSGPLEYTVWAVVNINGQWYTSGFIQMWRGRPGTGAPLLQPLPGCVTATNFACNWAYDGRWGAMNGYNPHPGEQVGFFLSAGNARGQTGVTSVRERTNVIVVSLPGGDSGVFSFSSGVVRR
jgi:hypothetical protein